MEVRVLLRRIAIATSSAVVVLVGLVVWVFAFPETYEVEHLLEASQTRIRMQFTPSHPYLAEYDRSIVVVWANGSESNVELVPDTGGYKRSQLYRASSGVLFVKGYFDVAVIDPTVRGLVVKSSGVPQEAQYIGAFDYVRDVGFRFLPPEVSAEEQLAAK